MPDINMLDLNLLRVFDTMVRERSVSLAAEKLNITQPAVSNALNRLRAVFEDPLFVRTRKGMEPTPLAQSLADPISHGLSSIRVAITQGITFDPATSQRRFTIITTDVGEVVVMVPLLRILNREAPHIDLRIMEAPGEEYEKLLDAGEADFAVGRVQMADTFRRELIDTCLYAALMCAENARRLGLRQGGIIPYETFMALPHVHVVPRGAGVHTNPVEPALGADAARRRVAVTLPHTSVLADMLPGTTMVATLPQPAAPPLCRRGDLAWLHLPFETEITRVEVVWHKRHDSDRGHMWMREKIRSIKMGA